MNQLILANELDFTTKSTKRFPMLKFRNKLFVLKKKTRNFDQSVLKCYWYCGTKSCNGAMTYQVNVNNAEANDGTGIALYYVHLIRCYSYCRAVINLLAQLVFVNVM